MSIRELCEVLDCVLEDLKGGRANFCAQTAALREIIVFYKIGPHWDHLPNEECELTWTEDGLFPEPEETR